MPLSQTMISDRNAKQYMTFKKAIYGLNVWPQLPKTTARKYQSISTDTSSHCSGFSRKRRVKIISAHLLQ
jgi:hypothetical protein